jgi:hypothetical protein
MRPIASSLWACASWTVPSHAILQGLVQLAQRGAARPELDHGDRDQQAERRRQCVERRALALRAGDLQLMARLEQGMQALELARRVVEQDLLDQPRVCAWTSSRRCSCSANTSAGERSPGREAGRAAGGPDSAGSRGRAPGSTS